MPSIQTRGFIEDDTIYWELEGNQIEFTLQEFEELIQGQVETGLFNFLRNVRPALLDWIFSIYRETMESDEEEKELEYILEQCLFGLEQKVRLK